MTTRQKTLTAGKEISDYTKQLEKSGYKELNGKRVPKGTTEKIVINMRRWCGDWSGWQTFKNEFVYYK